MTSSHWVRFLLWAILLFVAGYAAAALKPGDHEFSLTHKAIKRSYLVRMPPHASAHAPLPVVLNFHGGGSNAKTQKWYSRMDQTADRERFIAVYPNGTGGFGFFARPDEEGIKTSSPCACG